MTLVLRKGSRLGKYRLECKLGEGGSAVVWRARDAIEGRRVALKIVLPSVVEEFGRAAIEAEARVAAQLDHLCVAGIRNADWIDSRFVIVTDLAQSSLDRIRTARWAPDTILGVVRDVAEGLGYAHAKGLIHRDIKPANIFLYEGRRAKLGDFGTARLAPAATRLLTDAGTFCYMAPEQAYGRPRFASDVFSLALTAYEMWSGQLPGWPFEWPLEGAKRFSERCPEPVQPVIKRGLELDLAKRWVDGVAFHRALERAIVRMRSSQAKRKGGASVRSRRTTRKKAARDPFEVEARLFRAQYGKALQLDFDCHACDGPISESMSHCPWCGTSRNSFAEITRLPLVCPECERGVRPEWRGCPRCSAGRFESNGKPIPADRFAERACRRAGCGTPLRRFMRYCPACKLKVDRPWKVEGLGACQGCRWPIGARWRFCGWCGKKNRGAMDVKRRRSRT